MRIKALIKMGNIYLVFFFLLSPVIILQSIGLPMESRGYLMDESYSINNLHQITHQVPFDRQSMNQCAGYVASFVLRYYGFDLSGGDVYREMVYFRYYSYGIMPGKLVKTLNAHGLKANMYRGRTEHLYYYISRDIPVIVLIGEGLRWQHYLVLLGYNRDLSKFYFYDPSRGPLSGVSPYPGNRVMDKEEFTSLWQNRVPFYNNLYIPVKGRIDA